MFDVEAARGRFSSLRSGFAFFDAPGGTQVPDEVGEAIARALRDASGNLGAPYATGRAVEAILAGAKARRRALPRLQRRRGRLRHEHDLAQLRAQPRSRPRLRVPATRSSRPQLDHDGGVAPWVELAADKGMKVRRRRRDRRADRRLRRPRAEALRPHAGRGLRARLERDRLGRRRPADLPARPRGRRALLDRRRPLRGARAARGRRARLRRAPLLALQVLRAAPRHGLPAAGGRRVVAPLQGAALVVAARSGAASRPARCPTSCSRASRRRSPTSTRSAAWRCFATTSGPSASASSPTLPDRVTLYGPPTMAERVPTFLLNVDGVEAETVARTLGRARPRGLVRRQLVLRRARGTAPGELGARRPHPLQHRRRGRPARRRARCARRVARRASAARGLVLAQERRHVEQVARRLIDPRRRARRRRRPSRPARVSGGGAARRSRSRSR